MNPSHARLFFTVLIAAGAASAATPAVAQDWPARPVRMVVAYPPGGPADIAARLVAAKLTERLKQSVIVENRPGAGGNIGMEAVLRSAPDGYTVLYAVTGIVTNPATYKLSWDPIKDFAPVSQVSSSPFVLLANPQFAPRSVPEIIALARANPKSVTCAHSGSLPQIGCEWLRTLAKIEITTVPYKGIAQSMIAVSAGQVNLLFDAQISALPAVRAGRVRAIASANPRRGMGPFGELPTLAETLPGFEMDGWHGVFVPARTPREIVLRLNRELRAALMEDDMRKRFADAGTEVTPTTPEEFGDLVKRDLVKYEKIVREAGIKAE